MSAKAAIFVLCAHALVIQSALSQVCGRSTFGGASNLAAPAYAYGGLATGRAGNGIACNGLAGNNLAMNGLSAGLPGNSFARDSLCAPALEITPTSGGVLPVISTSAIAPNSISVESENVYEGALSVAGELPFVGTVGLEGVLPTAGSGAVNHACGNGATRMVSQGGAVIASGLGIGFAPAAASAAPRNMYGGAFRNTAVATPFGYNTGLAGLTYPAAGLAGVYPATGLASAYSAAGCGVGLAQYGGAGDGNVAVTGELPVAGTSAVAGQVPIMGAVKFSGGVPAVGAVSIIGNCACGCGSPYVY